MSGREQGERGTSLEAQRDVITRACAARGWPEPDIRPEVESAGEESIERRVELHQIIKEARAGDVIVVSKLDRWSRDIVFGVQSIRELTRRGVGWQSIDEGIDATTPNGDEQLGIRMWVAEQERRRIRDRTVGRREELRAQGLWAVGRVPYGYIRGAREKRRHLHLEEDPERAPVIRELFQRAADGASLREITDWLITIPGAPHHVAQVHRLMRERIYLGEMRAPVTREWIPGVHPALITLDVWERAQAGLAKRRHVGPAPGSEKTADLLLRGVASCALCGRRVGIALSRFGHRYYICSKRKHRAREGHCSGPYVDTTKLDAAATVALLARIGDVRVELAQGRTDAAREPAPFDLAAARKAVETRRARAVRLAVDDAITAAELRAQTTRLDGELRALEEREASSAREVRGKDPKARADVAKALQHLARSWAKLTTAERRKALQVLASRVEVTEVGALAWTWRSIADLVAAEVVPK